MKLPAAVEGMIADSKAVVRFGFPWWLRPFLARGLIGITLGRRIYLSAKVLEHSEGYIARQLRHELAHVRQYKRHGFIVFGIRYVSEFLRHFARERSINAAYRKISFEVEAVAAEDSL